MLLSNMDSGLGTSTSSLFDTSSPGSFGTSGEGWNWKMILVIVFVLALLGINIFTYLAQGTQEVTGIFGPIFKKLFGTAVAVTGQTVSVGAEGAKAVVHGTSSALEGGLTAVQQGASTVASAGKGGPSPLQQAIGGPPAGAGAAYEADYASSSIQGGGGKSGWCYVGEDRGYRSCAYVGINDKCMSGDVFPTQAVCVNPTLRA